MSIYLGLDPGGAQAFGWCVATSSGDGLPLDIVARGVGNSATDAVNAALQAVHGQPTSAGIDAPLFWRPDDDREADRLVRRRVVSLGGHNGTVQHVNSLRGACLIQGIPSAMLLRQEYPDLSITESHPKAILWLLRIANGGNPVDAVVLNSLPEFFTGDVAEASDHERDAAVGALSAWAMQTNPQGWQDLYPQEQQAMSPIGQRLSYWMPIYVDWRTNRNTLRTDSSGGPRMKSRNEARTRVDGSNFGQSPRPSSESGPSAGASKSLRRTE